MTHLQSRESFSISHRLQIRYFNIQTTEKIEACAQCQGRVGLCINDLREHAWKKKIDKLSTGKRGNNENNMIRLSKQQFLLIIKRTTIIKHEKNT